ncbi:MAG: methionyl-tRNA formyltransferase [Treponema sp.]|nr:methionyl-tRNA formyltransferase [Treponema sp.]
MRVLFAGSPGIAVPALKALAAMDREAELAGVLTNPDSPRGRRERPEPTEVSAAAAVLSAGREARGLPPIVQLKPEKLSREAREAAAALKLDLLLAFAYGRIFGPQFLSIFPLGGVNIHPSLLPRHRGASPIPAAILAGDRETGITIQRIAAEMDTGDILVQERFPLSGRETAASLSDLAAEKGARLVPPLLRGMAGGEARAVPQRGEASYCSRLSKDDGLIDWNLAAAEIDARIRAYTPWPLAYTSQAGRILYLLEGRPLEGEGRGGVPGTVLSAHKSLGILIQTGGGVLALTRLQYQAKKALFWKDFLNGAKDFIGARLG